ncbi:MAG TPA: bifunctional UDP-N-acetylmuramoyl-tripeptide:D-alanyl-D-alanine ligase/alanine racemase [Bacteroidia bacterium]|nr:bifunctional UDP-N-acetylmuramoyl-tripeptide:D-alanyl-D-alanine ligase/alanine racemase [Bacteroidia bacterium]
MARYTAKQTAEILTAETILPYPNAVITHLITDTRKIHSAATGLFFALTAARDGHMYIEQAYNAGVRNFVISRDIKEFNRFEDANFFKTPDTLIALQGLAAWHRQQFDIPLVGITGSNGKTIVKEWLYHLLRNDFNIVRSPKSYNSQIGVPLSVWEIDKGHTLGIFEAGISAPGEMSSLRDVILPSIGIFTNTGDAHNEGFSDKYIKAEEKASLFVACKKIVYSIDNRWANRAVNRLKKFNPQIELYGWSVAEQDGIVAKASTKAHAADITIKYKNNNYSFTIPFTDPASIENAINCAVTLLAMDLPLENYQQRFAELLPVEMRLQLKKGMRNSDIIDDTYSSDLNSLHIALDFLNSQKQHKNTAVILSDISESGLRPEELYKQVAQLIKEKNTGLFTGIGAEIFNHKHLFESTAEFYGNRTDFLTHFNFSKLADSTVLVKGARHFHFEKIVQRLEEKTHETVLEINLSAMAANLRFFRNFLNKRTKIMAMVKAYSYGSGSYETANMLQYNGADYLAVAYADEGIELRKKGITLPVMVMNPGSGQFTEMLEYYLEPEIYNFYVLDEFLKAFEESAEPAASIHLEFDTGMHRLGFEEKDIEQLISVINKHPEIKVASVFSHLSASDEAQHDEFTREQISRFEKIKEKLSPHLKDTLFHICNSSGITRFPQAQMDMVRLGIGLYGIDASGGYQDKLQPAFRLKTIISQVREVGSDESVGYSRKAIEHRPRKIAVAAIGYADGFRRELSNGKGRLKVNGQWAPVVGNVCMDMVMLDVTDINCHEGDEAIIFETNADIIELSKQLNTIPYEVLTGIGQRVKRVYWQE